MLGKLVCLFIRWQEEGWLVLDFCLSSCSKVASLTVLWICSLKGHFGYVAYKDTLDMWPTRTLWTCSLHEYFGHVANKDTLDVWPTRILWTCGQQGYFGHVAYKDTLNMWPKRTL